MTDKTFNLSGLSVMVGMPVHRDISPQTVRSMLNTYAEVIKGGIPIDVNMQHGSSLVHHARTCIAHDFLQSKCNRLFWIDSDISWDEKDFVKLVALSTEMEVVCAAYPLKSDPPVFFINVDDIDRELEANEFGCIQVKGAGLGFTIVQRKVMEELAAKAPMRKYPQREMPIPRIFRCDNDGEEERGEDMAFFADVIGLGYQVNLDPTVKLGHVGQKEYSSSVAEFCSVRKEKAAQAA